MWWAILTAWAWSPDPTGRFVVASELLMPQAQWFNDAEGRFGFETRSWQLRAVVQCRQAVDGKRRQVTCIVEDAALQASAFQRTPDDDPDHTAAVLRELGGRMRGLSITTVTTADGRVKSWTTDNRPEGSARETDTGYLLELSVERALCALWLERPSQSLDVGGQWIEARSPIYGFPRLQGVFAAGSSQVLHQVSAVAPRVVVDTVGRGTAAPGGEGLLLEGRSREVLDAGGALQERTWSVDASAQGTVSYHHAGWVVRVADGRAVDLGPTRQVRAPGEPEAADLAGLPPWPELGAPPLRQ